MINKEDVGFLVNGIRDEKKPSLATILARFDLEVVPAIESLGSELLGTVACIVNPVSPTLRVRGRELSRTLRRFRFSYWHS